MNIQTTRFGQVKVDQDAIIKFEDGIVGFSNLKNFVLLDDPTDDIFAWLQSCETPDIAFPVLEPVLFTSNYLFNLTKSEMESLKLTAQDKFHTFSIITIPDDPTQMTANLKAPIVINAKLKLGRQCVLQDNNLAIREPIFSKLQHRVVTNPTRTIKEQLTSIEKVAVRLPTVGA